MEADLVKALYEYVQERDSNEFALGDTLDVKTGLILAGLTFLAIQCGDFIKPGLPIWQAGARAISVFALVVGGGLSTWELWSRDYDREASPEKYDAWIADTEKYRTEHPGTDTASITADKLVSTRLESAKERVKTNLAINKRKSSLMFASFYCLCIAFAVNIATLIMRLF
jgi:hypothetical protein